MQGEGEGDRWEMRSGVFHIFTVSLQNSCSDSYTEDTELKQSLDVGQLTS